ncbi:MAG: class I SAM-dependent methyltransferase [Myxococcota bacterium]
MSEYDELPYPDALHEGTHIDALASRARLLGVRAPDPETARVLEVGCAIGGNLIALASALPNATFVGLDRSTTQIAEADRRRRDLGVTNLRFEAADLLDVDASWGEFDYIVAHGVFSWVPPDVADALLRLSARLSPNGVMYVSYNVFPGWSDRIAIRELVVRHTANLPSPRQRVAQARQLLEFLARQSPPGAWAHDLERILAEFHEHDDAYLFHEWLETHNHPQWFEDFVARASAAGLRYLTDVQLPRVVPGNYGPEVDATIGHMDELGTGRYLDFLGDRTFRQSLLVRADVDIDRRMDASRMREFRFSARFSADGPPPADGPWELHGRTGEFQASTPTAKAALAHLYAVRPERPSFDELVAVLPPESLDEKDLFETLLACVLRDWVGLHVWRSPLVSAVRTRPKAWWLARELASGDAVPSLLHQNVRVGPLGELFLKQLDGKRSLEDIARNLAKLEESGSLQVGWPGERPTSKRDRMVVLTALVENHVQSLAHLGLLVR